MSKIEEKAEKAWLDYEYRAGGDLYGTCFRDGYIQGATEALSHQWISVEDELPEDDAQALVMLEESSHPCFGVFSCLRWEVESADMILLSDVDDIRVTHWMPIPPLPGARKEGKV